MNWAIDLRQMVAARVANAESNEPRSRRRMRRILRHGDGLPGLDSVNTHLLVLEKNPSAADISWASFTYVGPRRSAAIRSRLYSDSSDFAYQDGGQEVMREPRKRRVVCTDKVMEERSLFTSRYPCDSTPNSVGVFNP